MNEMFRGFEFIRAYIYVLLIITKGGWYDHLNKLEQVIKKIKDSGLKCNINNSFFGQTKMEYLGFWVMRNGIHLANKKVEATVNMTQPKTIIQVCTLLVLVNDYRYIWSKLSHSLQPLTALTSNKVTFKWTYVEQNLFEKNKRIVARDTLLIYPDFNKSFDIHTYASYFQLGAVII